MKPETTAKQPKMQQRIALRLAIGLFGVAVLLFAWTFLKRLITNNWDVGHSNTVGWIIALRQTPSGEQVVALKPDDTVLDSPGYRDGAIDRDPVWQPDGDRIYFTSDRSPTDKSLQIYRWNPAQASVDQRSSGKLAQEHPIFQEDGASGGGDYTLLMIKAGVVVEFNPNNGAAHQRVPVEGKTPTQTGAEGVAGMGNQFGPEYEHLGTSFREAHWCKNRKYIAGIMRGDEGETLVVICLDPGPNPSRLDDGMPHGIVKGDHVDMAVDPASGNIAYAVTNFRFPDPAQVPPDMIKHGKVVLPFRNLLGIVNLDQYKGIEPIAAMPNADHTFVEPRISPDGTQLAFIEGADTNDGFKPQAIFVAPFAPGGGRTAKPLVTGMLSSPYWSPDGKQLAFAAVSPDGNSDIDVIPVAGGTLRVLTAGKGSFNSPRFSPMVAKAGS